MDQICEVLYDFCENMKEREINQPQLEKSEKGFPDETKSR